MSYYLSPALMNPDVGWMKLVRWALEEGSPFILHQIVLGAYRGTIPLQAAQDEIILLSRLLSLPSGGV
jgi:hypothetical protein